MPEAGASIPAPRSLPPTVVLQVHTPHLGHLMRGVTDAVRHLRPVPDLGALVRLAVSQLEPSLDVDGPVTLSLHRDAAGPWHATAIVPARAEVGATSAPDGEGPSPLRWSTRRSRRFTVHVGRLTPTLAVLTDAPTFVEAHAEALRLDAVRPPAVPMSTPSDAALDGRVTVQGRPPAWGLTRPASAAGEPGDAEGGGTPLSALSAWVTRFDEFVLDVGFSTEGIDARFRARAMPGSADAAALSAAVASVFPASAVGAPANASLWVEADARRASAGPLKPIAGSLEWLELLEAASPGGAEVGPGATDVLDPILDAVERDYVWSVQAGPGSVGPTLFFDIGLDTLPPALVALPEVYRLGGQPVRRLTGTGPFMPADLHFSRGRLRVAAGGAQRALLDAIVSGRLESKPPSQGVTSARGAVLRASADVGALLRLFGVAVPAARPVAPLTYVVESGAEGLDVRLRVPFGQLDGLADLLQRRAPTVLPENGGEWLFPDGI